MATTSVQIAGDPGALITIFDTSLRKVATGHPPFTVSLDESSYLIRGEMGDHLVEAAFKVASDKQQHQTLTLPPIRLPIFAPIKSSLHFNDQIGSLCNTLSQTVHHSYGKGSQLFICIRDIGILPNSSYRTQSVKTAQRYPELALSLLNDNREVIIEHVLEHTLFQESIGEHWGACTLNMNPGLYYLSTSVNQGKKLYQPIFLSDSWQTQVFLKVGNDCSRHEVYPDLCRSSLYMKQIGAGGFDPGSKECRLAELLIAGSPEINPVVSHDDIVKMAEEHSDPVLILHATYYLLARHPATEISKTIAAYLTAHLGDISDVAILRALGGKQHIKVNNPPLLWRSWRCTVTLSFDNPGLVPNDSLVCRIAGSVWGASPWFTWLDEEPQNHGTFPLITQMSTNTKIAILSTPAYPYPYHIAKEAKLTHLEVSLLIALTNMSAGDRSPVALAKMLRIPPVSIEHGLNGLITKLLGLAYSKPVLSKYLHSIVRLSVPHAQTLEIQLVKSPIGIPPKHRRALTGLGLRRPNQTVSRPNTSQVKGLVGMLGHLLSIKPSLGAYKGSTSLPGPGLS